MKFAFKKEFMYFSRTARLAGVLITVLAIAILDPFIFKGMQFMLVTMQDMSVEYGMDMNMDSVIKLLDLADAGSVAASMVTDLTTTSVIVIALILSQPSGGEQKKRSVIIPQCAGLTPARYAVPKFVIYPLTAFVTCFAAVPISVLISQPLFGGSVPIGNVLCSAFAAGLYLAFLITIELTFGICGESPVTAALLAIFSAYLLPSLFAGFGASKFHPFALPVIAQRALINGETDTLNVAASAGVTVILALILMFYTLFAMTAKQIVNSGDDPAL